MVYDLKIISIFQIVVGQDFEKKSYNFVVYS